MGEVISLRPVLDIRETFTPSEPLRRSLENFLDPNLDDETKKSLSAAFLFRSWLHRVSPAYERNRSVHSANKRFAALPKTHVLLNGLVDVSADHDSHVGLITVQARHNDVVNGADQILGDIPGISPVDKRFKGEERFSDQTGLFYTEIALKAMTKSQRRVTYATENLHFKSTHPAFAYHHFIMANQLVVRDRMANVQQARAKSDAE